MNWLAKYLKDKNFVIFDTETTGLSEFDQIVQIGLLSADGTVLMDQLVKPSIPIPDSARKIHGISDADVKNAPKIWEIEHQLSDLMTNRPVVVYNAPYDARMLQQSFYDVYAPYNGPGCKKSWPDRWFNNLEYLDVMIRYAEYYGDWDDYHGSYRWQKLSNAMLQQRLPVINAHNAIGDCRMVLALLNKFMDGA